MLGTATYLSPEQVGGGEASPATDQYSLGVVLYEMLTGQVPFPADNAVAAAIAHATREPRPPSELCRLPADLESIVLRCLEKDPADRFADAQSLARALAEVDTSLLPTADLPPVLLPTIDDDSPTPLLGPRPKLTSTHQRQRSRSPIVVTGVVTGVIALIVLLIWSLSDPSSVTASPDTTLTPPTVAETQITTTTIDTSTTLPPATVIEALAALSAYLQAIPPGDEIRPDLRRDLEQRLTEVTTEWIKDRKVEKTVEKLDEFVVRVSRDRRNSEIDPEWADRLIETAQQALALLTTGDSGDD
jgi:serine/threonine protein kinase